MGKTIKTQILFQGGGSVVVDIPYGTRLTKNILVEEAGNPSASDNIKLVLSWNTTDEYLPMFQELISMLVDAGLMKYADIHAIYRTKAFNSSLGNADPNSHHLQAAAMDLGWATTWLGNKSDLERYTVASMWKHICEEHGRTGYIIFYSNGFHVDCISSVWKIYDYRKTSKDW